MCICLYATEFERNYAIKLANNEEQTINYEEIMMSMDTLYNDNNYTIYISDSFWIAVYVKETQKVGFTRISYYNVVEVDTLKLRNNP